MQPYFYETLYYLYLFWFKPLTLHRQLNELAGDKKILGTSLFTLLRQPKSRQTLMTRSKLWYVIAQIVLGHFLLLLIGTMLVVWLSDISGLTLLMGGTESAYWTRVAGAVALGMGVGVAVGVGFGVVVSVAKGVVVSVAEGVAVAVAVAVAVGVTVAVIVGMKATYFESLAEGVAEGVAGGVAVAVAMILTFFRLPLVPLWIIWSFLQLWIVEQGLGDEKQAFTYSAIQLDELIYVPLPLFDRLLVRCMQAMPAKAANMLAQTAQSTGQKWAVAYAAMHWATQVEPVAITLPELATVAQRCDAAADVLTNMSDKNEKVGNLLRDLAAVADSLATIDQAHTVAVAIRVLERNRAKLDSLKMSAGVLKRNELANMAEYWQRLIQVHAKQLEKAPRMVLTGAYQAGSALEVGSRLFRGRRDLFNITNEVYANPHRAETLLLVGQQRMGKSSALMQLPAQLPDAHVVIVDCQGAITGTGDEVFAVGISAAINKWEKRRPGGLRQAPLELEQVAASRSSVRTQPLHQLNRWLERYADRARGKRILLCLDEFDKLVRFVAEGRLSEDVLAFLRALSQDPGWMVLYSGQFELDNWAAKYAEYLKNVRRVRISYLQANEARSLLEDPVPDFALTWQRDATDAVLQWTGCQPFLLQMMGTQVVNRLSPTERRTVTKEDIDAIEANMFDSGRYYFHSLQRAFGPTEHNALHDIAHSGHTNAARDVLERLVDYEYIEKNDDGGWRFRVPLLREWYRRQKRVEELRGNGT